jgi:hypothetical protein
MRERGKGKREKQKGMEYGVWSLEFRKQKSREAEKQLAIQENKIQDDKTPSISINNFFLSSCIL